MIPLRVLHLVGSATDGFYCDLSRMYAQTCIQATANPSRYDVLIAYITPDRCWRFPKSLSKEDIEAAQVLPVSEAIQVLLKENVDVAVPHMYCILGMTAYRSLLDLLKIPYVGSSPDVMAISSDKAKTRAIASAAGVRVPDGEVLRRGETSQLPLPVVVKPTNADNSLGVTLVKHREDYAAALERAFTYSEEVLVERFIELGREMRCGIVVQNGKPVCLPLKEYRMDADCQPIRAYENKLQRNHQGNIELTAKDSIDAWAVEADDPDVARVWAAARQCHRALGCRHYSLFDFRIDPEGQPWFIEAGLYCSFGPGSILTSMMSAAGTPLETFFQDMLQQAMVK